MHRKFCIALQDPSDQVIYFTFGPHATVNDIADVIEEEAAGSGTYTILGMSVFSTPNKKSLPELESAWKDEVMNRVVMEEHK